MEAINECDHFCRPADPSLLKNPRSISCFRAQGGSGPADSPPSPPHTNSGYPQFNLMSINQSLDQHSGNYWVPAWAPLIDERKIHHWAPLAAYTICRFHLEVVAAFDSHAATSSSGFSRARRRRGRNDTVIEGMGAVTSSVEKFQFVA